MDPADHVGRIVLEAPGQIDTRANTSERRPNHATRLSDARDLVAAAAAVFSDDITTLGGIASAGQRGHSLGALPLDLMARALGARVRPSAAKEIGYAPLTITEAGRHTPIASIGEQAVLHWHGDQFDLPSGVPSLAGTSVCPHQALMVGEHAMAWQFHLEVDARQIERWLIGHAVELAQACIPPSRIREQANRHREGLSQTLNAVLDEWFKRLQLI